MFEDKGILFASEGLVYQFVRALDSQELKLTGHEPPIGKVINGDVSWKPEPGVKPLAYANAHKYISALSELSVEQNTMLNREARGLRQISSTLRAWEKNVKTRQNSRRKKSA